MCRIKLLDCPFCGGKAHIGITYKDRISQTLYGAECEECHACIGVFYTQDDAIRAWNRRTTDAKKHDNCPHCGARMEGTDADT